jgi:2-polyprenyl-3-methyl-5-hydroxy-6-metoxy-1,4-benzoquinol methylase
MSPRPASVTQSLAAPRSLYPHLVPLFRGLPSLGSSPRTITRLLQDSGVTSRSTMLDLACGKGALALAAAAAISCRVHAVDAYEGFIAEARRSARRRGLEHLVSFECADVEQYRKPAPFDAVTMIGLWPVEKGVERLRSLVRPRGVYIIDDVFFDPSRSRRVQVGRPGPPTLAEVEQLVTDHGDRVERVHVESLTRLTIRSARALDRLQVNAAGLAAAHPSLRKDLGAFIAHHRRAARLLTGSWRPAVWVIRKGAGRRARGVRL